jgi:general secretion pathway protein H
MRNIRQCHNAVGAGRCEGVEHDEVTGWVLADARRADVVKGCGGKQRPFTVASRSDGIIRGVTGSSRGRGFSLLEMLLVVTLIAATGLLAAGVLSGGLDRLQLKSSAKEIASQLRYTRAHAIATGTPQRFVIDPAAHAWQAANNRSGEVPERLGIAFTGAREIQSRAGEGAILFFGDGASTGGRVQLNFRQAAWNVDVAWLTGEVTLQRAEADR